MIYRPDIDGLRAIAIIFVLIYHGSLTLFPSGYMGVDIFFVISGYLITSIIHQSMQKGSFSIFDFYTRRLWRLQPVFVCLLLVTMGLAFIYFLPLDFMQYSRSMRKTSLWISNLFFNKTTTGYFAPDTHQLPLLHTWSLSIEWQCYLLLPVFMYASYRYCSTRNFYLLFGVLTLTAIAYAQYNSWHKPQHSYYLLTSRLYEFLIGACVALLPSIKWSANKMHQFLCHFLGISAVLVLLYMAHQKPVLAGYPDWKALVVCVTTGILIALGRFYPLNISYRLLALKPMVAVGLLSYSLYIWHWVIFSFIRYHEIEESLLILLGVYILTFILAYCSWRWIEKPTRRLHHLSFSTSVFLLLVIPVIFLHAIGYLVKANQGFPQRFSGELKSIYHELAQYESKLRPQCMSHRKNDVNLKCINGAKKENSKKAFMIGDSFSNHYWGFMDVLGKDADVSILMHGVAACIALPGIYLYDWWYFRNQPYQHCFEQNMKSYQMIKENHFDYVILGQIWGNYLSDSVINHLNDKRSIDLAKKRISKSLEQALSIITKSGARPVIIKSTAGMQPNFHNCFFRHIKLRRSYNPKDCELPFSFSESDQWFDRLFQKMKIKFPLLIIVDPKEVQCKKKCKVVINGIPVYRDIGHITDYASYYFGKKYLEQFGNPMSS